MKPAVYVETTIPSYYTARPSRDVIIAGHQATTREWWDTRLPHFRIFISQLVLDEAGLGDSEFAARRLEMLKPFPLLDLRDDITELARSFLQAGTLPAKAVGDAVHIALAALMASTSCSLGIVLTLRTRKSSRRLPESAMTTASNVQSFAHPMR